MITMKKHAIFVENGVFFLQERSDGFHDKADTAAPERYLLHGISGHPAAQLLSFEEIRLDVRDAVGAYRYAAHSK